MSIFDLLGSGATDAMQHVIEFTTRRHKVLVNNIANIDTPGYRMQDVSAEEFDRTLARTIQRSKRANPNVLRLDVPEPDGSGDRASSRGPDAEKLRGITFHDDNDRSIETLVVTLNKNAAKQTQAVGLLRNQIRLLRAIIAETAAGT